MIDIALYILAALGAISLLFILWMIVDEWRNPGIIMPTPPNAITPNSRKDDALEYLDNEVRGQMRYDRSIVRGRVELHEPTLKGRVDMIEKHLGITVGVEQEKPAKLVVNKQRGKK